MAPKRIALAPPPAKVRGFSWWTDEIMANPVDMIIPLLRDMRAESAASDDKTRALIVGSEKRLGAVEKTLKSVRQAPTADTLLSKLVTGEFEERIETLERKVQELESQK
jgi:hypothetical protein